MNSMSTAARIPDSTNDAPVRHRMPTHGFDARAEGTLKMLHESGQYKHLRMIDSPMDAVVNVRGYGECVCFCSNNYLGLANHPEVVEAGTRALKDYGAGTASVRFICGTFGPHETLEKTIADYMGTEASYSFVSAWTANEAVFPTLCEPGDVIISDELNHACIIDSIRLAAVIKKGVHKSVYKHNTLEGHAGLRERLEEARKTIAGEGNTGKAQIWVVTDGVFSMEGDIADLLTMRRMCDEFDAMLVVDDSHGHGVMGKHGRGTHEHFHLVGHIDVFTGTLGKALGGGAGGFVAASKRVIEMLVQRGRPTLFSNALPVTIAASATKAIEILMREPERVQRLRDNSAYARLKIREAGFTVVESPTAICPIIVHDTAKAIAMSKRLLELGVFVIGFGYPVVPEGEARLRVQISAAHTRQHIDTLVGALKKL